MMVAETVRTHVVIPRDVLDEVDRVAGQRRRSDFVTEALREKLQRERQAHALREGIGALDPDDYPDWRTPRKTSAWVRRTRAADNAALKRTWRRYERR
jgi:hypothetical protein